MKKVLLILWLMYCSFGMVLFGQKNSIKLAPLDMFTGIYSLTYERALSDESSLLLTTRHTDVSRREDADTGVFTILDGNKYIQVGFDWEFAFRRFFRGNMAMKGFYLQHGFVVGHYDITYYLKGNDLFLNIDDRPDFSEKLMVYSIALKTGYQSSLGEHLILELGFGGRMNKVFETLDPLNFPISSSLNGLVPTGSLKLGYAF